jgi:hypothetical protein
MHVIHKLENEYDATNIIFDLKQMQVIDEIEWHK